MLKTLLTTVTEVQKIETKYSSPPSPPSPPDLLRVQTFETEFMKMQQRGKRTTQGMRKSFAAKKSGSRILRKVFHHGRGRDDAKHSESGVELFIERIAEEIRLLDQHPGPDQSIDMENMERVNTRQRLILKKISNWVSQTHNG